MTSESKKRFTKRNIPTIRDVAAAAGVAPATVSNVLSGRRSVRDELKARVMAAIESVGYRPNRLASSLRLNETHAIGVVVPDITNPFFSALVRRLEERAAEDGYQILLSDTGEDETQEIERLRTLISRRIDGLIVMPARDEAMSLDVHSTYLPATIVMDRAFGHAQFDTVSVNNEEAVRQACQHLIGLGHSDILFVATSTRLANIRERIKGYRAALHEAGLDTSARLVCAGFDVEHCRGEVEQVLRSSRRPTAILTANYVASLGAIKAVRALDLEFPDTISLLAFDDSDWMTVLRPYLSVIMQPVAAMADRAWDLLKLRMEHAEAPRRHERLDCALCIRESTRQPPVDARRPNSEVASHR